MQGEHRMHVSISIGVAPLDTEAGELMHSLAAAETACKAAKDRGRNRVETYQADDQSIVRRFTDINIAARLRVAISEDRLRLDAQLIAPFINGRERSPALRAAAADDRRGRPDARPRSFPVGRQPLPAHADDRPMGDRQGASRC